jgi:hypothetical protein
VVLLGVAKWHVALSQRMQGCSAFNAGATSAGICSHYVSQLFYSDFTRLAVLYLSCHRVLGIWPALTFGTALQGVAVCVLISRFDWNKEVHPC